MDSFRDRVAFISGAGGGLGAGLARVLAQHGATLALVDLQADLLDARRAEFGALGVRCATACVDVSDAAAVQSAAERFERELGEVELCINNAAVGYVGEPADQVPSADYDWVLAVNVRGVINGVTAFVPRMRARRRGYVVNVASVDGLLPTPGLHHAPYCMSKAAVVLYSDGLRHDLAASGVGVSVVCPGLVRSNLPNSSRLRPARYGGSYVRPGADAFRSAMDAHGLAPEQAAAIILAGVRDRRFWIFTHAGYRDELAARARDWQEALDWTEQIAAEVGVAEPSRAR